VTGNGGVDGQREEIAAIDRAIAALLAQRLSLARAVGALKREANVDAYAPAQEVAVYERIRAAAGDEVPSAAADALARELISAGLYAQRAIEVGCIGEPFGPAWSAAARAFGSMAAPRRVESIAAAIEQLLEGRLDYLVARVDVGLYEGLTSSQLKICRRADLPGADAYAVVGRQVSEPSGRDITAVRLIGWSAPAEAVNRLAPGLTGRWLLSEGDLVVELPGHPERGALREIECSGRISGHFDRCTVLGSWPLFPGEVEVER
jgi:chorismate mutase